ncbi:MAG: hypothetical protein E6I75_28275 [Chloroflexi bacterium]|nr:MAG: hypothetical protein E6I75_28275 [Chloroflexota bacterium]
MHQRRQPNSVARSHAACGTGAAQEVKLPGITGTLPFAESGLLMAYGVNRATLTRRAAEFVDKILKGANPADLPVEQPTVFDLVVNVKTLNALGLMIPPSVLPLVTEWIE